MGTTLTVAIVGSGPSGFYACEALLKSQVDVQISMFERLPTPFGLVRYGVAPDHPKLKQVCTLFQSIASDERVSFFGNVEIGRDLAISELLVCHHAVVICTGADRDRRLDVPGEHLRGSHAAMDFVGWYNGHPDFSRREFDLTPGAAVIIGQGNVAADICRVLARPVSELQNTDISEEALLYLSQNRVREIHVVGRRGPAQAKFTIKELREICSITNCVAAVSERPALAAEDLAELNDPSNSNARQCVQLFDSLPTPSSIPPGSRRIIFHFLSSPVEIRGNERVESIALARNRLTGPPFNRRSESLGDCYQIPCGLCIRSIGQFSAEMYGLPYDATRGTLVNKGGRITDTEGRILLGLYTSGWAKRGATGVIGSNRADSVESVEALLSDAGALLSKQISRASLLDKLRARGIDFVTFERWLRIDRAEVFLGSSAGRPRAKFLTIEQMLALR